MRNSAEEISFNPDENGFGFFYCPERRDMNIKDWKKRLMEILKEHPDVGPKMTGHVEVNINEGGISKIFVFKELK